MTSRVYFPLLLLFFVSGSSSLMFETLWQRLMVLVFGASAPATAAILIAFFLGLGLGSFIGGRILERFDRALLFYACVEFWIGLWSLAVPALLGAMGLLLIEFGDSNQITALPYLVRLLLAIAMVLPATLGMGATIPVMNRLIHEHGRGIGYSTALAYGINTLGAVAGCLLTGIFLIRSLGVQNSLYVASALNLFVVVISTALVRYSPKRSSGQVDAPESIQDQPTPQSLADSKIIHLLLPFYIVSGFLALGYEIVWLRMLSLFTSTSTTTFAIVLAVYLTGFSLGSLLLYPILSKRMSGVRVFVISNLMAGISTSLLLPTFYQFPFMRFKIAFPDGEMVPVTLFRAVLVEGLMATIMMFLPTIFLGLAFPAVCQALISTGKELGRKSGLYYFAGNLGSAIGVGVTALLLLPAMGLIGSLLLLCVIGIAVGLITLGLSPDRPKRIMPYALIVIYVGTILTYGSQMLPFVRDGKLERIKGQLTYHPFGPTWDTASGIRQSDILRYKSGRSATVIVKNVTLASEPDAPFNALYIDGLHVASTHMHSTIDAKMLAHIPLLLHPDPKSALTVGFGSGGTSWSMTQHVIKATAVEIEPEVIRSAKLFANQNHGVLDEPNFELILNDARNHLLVSDRKYDVISTDVTNLQYRQNSSLYTREYFQLMKDRLSDDGIACAWIPMMAISDEEFKMLLRTFGDVFPHASLWYIDYSQTNFGILIGTPGPMTFDMNRIRDYASSPKIMQDLEAIGLQDPVQIPLCLYLDEEGYHQYVGDGLLHTDDHPYLEFMSAVSYYNFNVDDEFGKRVAGIRPFRPQSIASMLVNADQVETQRFEHYERIHRIWARAVWLKYFDRDIEASDANEQMLAIIDEVLAIDPDFKPALKLQSEMRP